MLILQRKNYFLPLNNNKAKNPFQRRQQQFNENKSEVEKFNNKTRRDRKTFHQLVQFALAAKFFFIVFLSFQLKWGFVRGELF